MREKTKISVYFVKKRNFHDLNHEFSSFLLHNSDQFKKNFFYILFNKLKFSKKFKSFNSILKKLSILKSV